MSWGDGPGDPPTDPEGNRWRESDEDDGPVDDEARRDLEEWLGPDADVEDDLDEDDDIDDADDYCPDCFADWDKCDCDDDPRDDDEEDSDAPA